MARLAMRVKNERKKVMAKKYFKFRQTLRETISNAKLPDEERMAANIKLQKLPRNTSHVRNATRCQITGRARGNYRKFGLCRIKFRELALLGRLPGVTKASW